jgi:hypothetical protein
VCCVGRIVFEFESRQPCWITFSRRELEIDNLDRCANRYQQPAPALTYQLQISVNEDQPKTIKATVLQRIRSAALRANHAIARLTAGCVDLLRGFDFSVQCRPLPSSISRRLRLGLRSHMRPDRPSWHARRVQRTVESSKSRHVCCECPQSNLCLRRSSELIWDSASAWTYPTNGGGN